MKVDDTKTGRPRDPLLEARAYAAARSVYAARGWSGFGFNQVAQAAGIGKGALYRRWSNPSELLLDALKVSVPRDQVYFSVREELASLVAHMLTVYSGRDGLAPLRVFIEARAYPEVFAEFRAKLLDPNLRRVREIVRRGISSGELEADLDVTLLLNILHGAVISHSMVQPENAEPVDQAAIDKFSYALIKRVLPPLS